MSQSTHSSVGENEKIVSVELCTYVKVIILREKSTFYVRNVTLYRLSVTQSHYVNI